MSEVADFIRLALEIVGCRNERRRALEENSWDALIETASILQELLPQHESAIRAVVSPVLFERDLDTTCRRYRELAEGAAVFSSAYEDAQGMLGVAHQFKQFEEGLGMNRLSLVCHRLGEFQWAAFCLAWRSEDMANLLYEANELIAQMVRAQRGEFSPEEVTAQRERVRESFQINAFSALRPRRDNNTTVGPSIGALITQEHVITIVQDWCMTWLDRVSAALYQGGPCGICNDTNHTPSRYGLFRILGQLKATRFEV